MSLCRLLWAAAVLAGCTQTLRLTPDDSAVVLAHTTIRAANPGDRGAFRVKTLYYGSGTDRRRAVFRDSIAIRTPTVDASKLVSVPKGLESLWRRYWGFGAETLPLNAKVWYPGNGGPFPLILVVHGNHDPRDFSDPGYEWLGDHLASRGFIVASVDENFLNGPMTQENDARAWLLLEHLVRWRAWNDSSTGPFRGKVDMGRIALIGHSRGGEAVAHAAAFNRLARYPDDATMAFDYGFEIKAVIAIAPVDAQYKPAGRLMPLTDVNYLVVHGSHDGDVTSFHGLRQYQRVRFTDGHSGFKAAFYVYRANHGQWNTVWQDRDRGPWRSPRQLDRRALLSPEAQRQFARVVFSAFVEATLHGRCEYLPMFRDHRTAGTWLPRTMYVTRFEDASFRPVADFEEDVDPTTGSAPGVRLEGDSLATWKEGTITLRSPLRDGDESMNTAGVWLGWDTAGTTAGATASGHPPRFTIQMSDSVGEGRAEASLVLSLVPTSDSPKAPGSEKGTRAGGPPTAAADTTAVDLTIEVEDGAGHVARQPLSRYGPVRRPLETHVLRRADRERLLLPTAHELVLQTYVLPLSDFASASSGFDSDHLRSVRLVFDQTPAGMVLLDDLGFARLDPRFFVGTDRCRGSF